MAYDFGNFCTPSNFSYCKSNYNEYFNEKVEEEGRIIYSSRLKSQAGYITDKNSKAIKWLGFLIYLI